MNKKIVVSIVAVILIVMVALLGKNYKDRKSTEDVIDEVESSFLTSMVLDITGQQLTLQDENNVIYTFLVTDSVGLEVAVGENIQLEYKGELDKSKAMQTNEVIGYKILETANNKLPDVWNDKGIFSKYYEDALETLNGLSLDEKIGQIILPRVPDTGAIDDLIKYKFGGYVLYTKDFENKEKTEVITMINNFQNNSKIPLLIATDEEGGTIVRASSNSKLIDTPFKSPRDVYKDGGLDAVKNDIIKKSEFLTSLGINLNLAPVVDVSTSPDNYIYQRSLGESATTTADFAKTVINASKGKNVSYTLKHFPGYGANTDTHQGESKDSRDKDTIMKNDILPFQAGVEAGAEAVMMSHHISEAFDKDNPSSLSKEVHNLLRNDLKFTGIIMTDDLDMAGITAPHKNTMIKDAILSGNDILIVTDYKTAITKIKALLDSGEVSEDMISKLAFRVLAWKYYKGLILPNQK